MSHDHDELRLLLGAYVLGGLDDDDHRAFTEHLRTCSECQREAAQLGGLPRLLDLAPMDSLSDEEPSPDPARHEAGRAVVAGRLHQRRRTRHLALAAAAVVVALLTGLAGFTLGRSSTGVATVAQAPDVRLAAQAAPGARAQVQIGLVTKAWGTELQVAGSALPTGGTMALWVVDEEGRSSQVATWSGTPNGQAALRAASSVRAAAIRIVEVRSGDGTMLATASR